MFTGNTDLNPALKDKIDNVIESVRLEAITKLESRKAKVESDRRKLRM
jgi:hypothetical protein